MTNSALHPVAFVVLRLSLGVVLLLVFLNYSASAQSTRSSTDGSTPLGLAPGAPAGAYALSEFDNVNLYSGNLNFRLPLLHSVGRGGARHTLTLPIEQKWRVRHDTDSYNQHYYSPDPNWWTGIQPGYGPGVLQGRRSGEGSQQCYSPPYDTYYNFTLTRLTFTASDGTEYELRDESTNGQPAAVSILSGCNATTASRGTIFKTADGSAATFISDSIISDESLIINGQPSGGGVFYPTGYLALRDGTRYRIVNGLVTWTRDRNGNRLSFGYDAFSRVITITDSLNRQVTVCYAAATGCHASYDLITFKGYGGSARNIRVWRASLQSALRPNSGYSIQYYNQLFPQLNSASSSLQFNPSVVSSVELPDGRQFRFYYNPYGELARVELPTGGAIEYDYAAGVVGETLYNYLTGTINESLSGVTAGSNPQGGDEYEVYRRVVEQRIYPDGVTLEGKTAYSRPESYSFPSGYTTLGYVLMDRLTPGGALLARDKHYYYGFTRGSLFQGPTDYPAWKDGREYQTEAAHTDGTSVLRRAAQTWQQRAAVSWWTGSPDSAPPNDPRLTETLATLVDVNKVAKQTFLYDLYNNQTDLYEYDYGAGAPLTHPSRRKHTDYVTTYNGANYAGDNNIHLRPTVARDSLCCQPRNRGGDLGGADRVRV